MSSLIIVVNEDGFPCYGAKMSANRELLFKAAQELMEDSGCRNAYIMKQVEPKGPYITYMYKVGAKLVYEGPLKGKSPRVVILKHSK